MSNKQAKGKSKEAYFSRYKASGVFAANRKRKLEKLLKKQPNNEQIKVALKSIVYRRGTPKTHQWDKSQIAVAKLFKAFVGKFDKNVFNPNPEVQAAALKVRNSAIFDNYKMPQQPKGSMFSLKERAHSNGTRVWI